MNYNQLEQISEINLNLEMYEDSMFQLQHQIAIEKQKEQINQSILGKLRHKLNKVHERYCDMYLMKYEI